MKKIFAETFNVKKYVTALRQVVEAPAGIDRMALMFGKPGLGKTETSLWWVNTIGREFGAVYIRTKKLMSGRWLLEEIVAELGEAPLYKTADLFRQCVDALIGSDRVVILDEVDYLTHDSRVIETIRDIADTTLSPFVFVGMETADKKLKRYRHLWRRFSQVVEFEPLGREDAALVLGQICDVALDDSAIDYICKREGTELTAAKLYRWAQACETLARRKGLASVGGSDLG